MRQNELLEPHSVWLIQHAEPSRLSKEQLRKRLWHLAFYSVAQPCRGPSLVPPKIRNIAKLF